MDEVVEQLKSRLGLDDEKAVQPPKTVVDFLKRARAARWKCICAPSIKSIQMRFFLKVEEQLCLEEGR